MASERVSVEKMYKKKKKKLKAGGGRGDGASGTEVTGVQGRSGFGKENRAGKTMTKEGPRSSSMDLDSSGAEEFVSAKSKKKKEMETNSKKRKAAAKGEDDPAIAAGVTDAGMVEGIGAENLMKKKKKKKKNLKKQKIVAKEKDELASANAMGSTGYGKDGGVARTGKKNSRKQSEAAKVEDDGKSAHDVLSGQNVDGASFRDGGVLDANPRGKSAPAGMQIYWSLSAVDADVREEAAGALVRELVQAQRDFEDNRSSGLEERAAEAAILGEAKDEEEGMQACAPAVQYALRRLIRGVASSREGARQGFALALTSVLGALPTCVDSAALLRMIDKYLEMTSSMKGQEARDLLLGQLFAFGALVRSPLVESGSGRSGHGAFVKEVTERLLTVGLKKAFLLEAAICIVGELGEKLENAVLEEGICSAPSFSGVLQRQAESVSPDHLGLALRLYSRLPNSTVRSWTVIPDSGNLIDIFDKEHLLLLAPCLKESTKSYPRVHGVWDLLIQILFSDSMQLDSIVKKSGSKERKKKKRDSELEIAGRLSTFWSTLVDEHLLKSSPERKHLAFELLIKLLPRLPNPVYAKCVLSKSTVQCLLHACSEKDLLHKTAKNCIAEVCKWAEETDERRVSVVIALQQGSQGKFDQTSKTQSVKGLIGALSTVAGYQALAESLSKFYVSGESGEDGGRSNLFTTSKKQKSVKDSGTSNNDEANDATLDTIALQRKWALDQLRALCQQALVGLQAEVVVQELINKFVSLLTPVRPFTEEEEQALSTLQSAVTQVGKSVSQSGAGETKDRLQAMLALLVQLLFESRLNPRIVLETASEIAVCCRKAFGDLQLDISSEGDEDEEEPAFMDVLVDVILSLLAQSSAPIRSAAEQVFRAFSGNLTSSGLSDLLRIVKKNTQRSRHKPVVEVDSDEAADDEDVVDVEDSDDDLQDKEIGDANASNKDDDGSGDEDEDEDEDEPLAKQSRVSDVRKKDQPTTADGKEGELDEQSGDEESESEGDGEGEGEGSEAEVSDLDDEAMFRMDKHLASILKQRKQGGGSGSNESKDAQTQLLHFKFRVLSLIEYFVQKHSNSNLVLTVLPSLLHVYANSCTTDGNGQIADRVRSILVNKLFRGKEYPKGSEVDQENVKGLLTRSLKLASRSTVKGVSAVAQAACHWLLKVIHGSLERGKDEDVQEMLSGALDNFFVHKKCRLPSSFFKDVFIRNPILGQRLLGNVLERSKSARSECLRFEALQMAGTTLGFKSGKASKKSKQLVPNASPQLVSSYVELHIPAIKSVIIHLLTTAPSTKSNRRSEALQFCVSFLDMYRALYPGRPIAELLPADILASAVKEVSAPPKSKQASLLQKLQQLDDRTRTQAA